MMISRQCKDFVVKDDRCVGRQGDDLKQQWTKKGLRVERACYG